MKKYFKKVLLIIFLFALMFDSNIAMQQEVVANQGDWTLVASVGIYNIETTKISSDEYDISFQILNDEGIQSDIRYGLQLINLANNSVVDTQLVNESITLAEKEKKSFTLSYKMPAFIESGEYVLLITAQNKNGLSLASVPAIGSEQKIVIKNNISAPVLEDCYLISSSDANKKYEPSKSVIISPKENLSIVCKLVNKGKNSYKDILVQRVTHKNNSFGDIINNEKMKEHYYNLTSNSSKEIIINLLNTATPGVYVEDIFLINKDGKKISSSLYAYYTISGSYAFIDNAILDKNSYNIGEKANLKVYWTPYIDINQGLGQIKDYTVIAKINDSSNELCGSQSVIKKGTPGMNAVSFEIAIEKKCQNALALVQVTDNQGKVLDSAEININNPVQNININSGVEVEHSSSFTNLNKTYVVLAFLFIIVISYAILALKKKI